MKWFKHDANASTDAKLRKVRIKYGMEGYGIYWYCLELIAANVEKHNLSFELEHDAEIIAHDTGIHFERVEEMMRYMVNLNLFEESSGRVTCLKMATRTDEYTQKLIRDSGVVPTLSGHSPDSAPRKSLLIEEKRIEEKRKEPRQADAMTVVADSIIDQLNAITGKQFKRTKANRTAVAARLRDGFTQSDCVRVIENRAKLWLGTEMDEYLRPSTLFQASKFEGYLNDNSSRQKSGQQSEEHIV